MYYYEGLRALYSFHNALMRALATPRSPYVRVENRQGNENGLFRPDRPGTLTDARIHVEVKQGLRTAAKGDASQHPRSQDRYEKRQQTTQTSTEGSATAHSGSPSIQSSKPPTPPNTTKRCLRDTSAQRISTTDQISERQKTRSFVE